MEEWKSGFLAAFSWWLLVCIQYWLTMFRPERELPSSTSVRRQLQILTTEIKDILVILISLALLYKLITISQSTIGAWTTGLLSSKCIVRLRTFPWMRRERRIAQNWRSFKHFGFLGICLWIHRYSLRRSSKYYIAQRASSHFSAEQSIVTPCTPRRQHSSTQCLFNSFQNTKFSPKSSIIDTNETHIALPVVQTYQLHISTYAVRSMHSFKYSRYLQYLLCPLLCLFLPTFLSLSPSPSPKEVPRKLCATLLRVSIVLTWASITSIYPAFFARNRVFISRECTSLDTGLCSNNRWMMFGSDRIGYAA